MKFFVTGATGFTGGFVARELRRRGLPARCLARAGSDVSLLQQLGLEIVTGDLANVDLLATQLRGTDALINVASLGFGHAEGIVQALRTAGVQRAAFVSTTAIFTSLNAPSKTVRLAAEAAIQGAGIAHTILRPTMIFGTHRDRNMCRLLRLLQRSPVLPILGDGTSLQQPIYVEDLAGAIVAASLTEQTIGHAYNLSGAQPLTFNQVVDLACAALQRRVRKLHLPARPIVRALAAAERLGMRLPIKAEQVQRLNEDKAFPHTEATRDFGFQPRTFADAIALEVADLARARAGAPSR